MKSVRKSVSGAPATSTKFGKFSGVCQECAPSRVARLYASDGGPLIAWLLDEARVRGQQLQDLSRELGVTSGYINQLRNGIRQTAQISHDMSVACARYLGVPAVVVKVVSGQIRMGDFVWPHQTEEQLVERAFQRMLLDATVRPSLPARAHQLSFEAKKALVLLYMDGASQDVLGLHRLPEVVRWLQRAVLIHDESEGEAQRGHRDIAA